MRCILKNTWTFRVIGLRSQKHNKQTLPQNDDGRKQQVPMYKNIHYCVVNNLLYRAHKQDNGTLLQLVMATSLRHQFIHYAHNIPISGHLGRMKTLHMRLEVAYWLEIRKDVWSFCMNRISES